MRSEQDMFDLILRVANADERIRAVYLNGSRANPNVEKDAFQDYDVVYVVRETESFVADRHWISVFGEFAIVQEPDSPDLGWGRNHDFSRSYAWLMLAKDGNRIDLQITAKEAAVEAYRSDSLTVLLLDKDGFLPELPPSSDRGYWIKPPANETYRGCCNEFWWCLNNVAKGIARKQLPYAMRMYACVVHPELDRMTEWYIGAGNGFSVTTGMWGKYFSKYLPADLYAKYAATYSNGDDSNFWTAIFNACELFGFLAAKVGAHFGFAYIADEEKNILHYLNFVRTGERGHLSTGSSGP